MGSWQWTTVSCQWWSLHRYNGTTVGEYEVEERTDEIRKGNHQPLPILCFTSKVIMVAMLGISTIPYSLHLIFSAKEKSRHHERRVVVWKQASYTHKKVPSSLWLYINLSKNVFEHLNLRKHVLQRAVY